MGTAFSSRLASIAESEFDRFHGFHETTSTMANRIKKYYRDINLTFESVGVAWSAVFISFCVKTAGATSDEFRFSARHGIFVRKAIKNAIEGTGFFRGRRLTEYAPKLGDIIQNNRNGHAFDFDFATKNDEYESHTAIVVEEGIDGSGRYVRTIGGNESDTVGNKIVRIRSNGLIVQPKSDPSRFICIIENMM